MLEIRSQSPMPWHCFTASQTWGSRRHPGSREGKVWDLQMEGLAGGSRTIYLDRLDDDGIEESDFAIYSYRFTHRSAPSSFSRPEVLQQTQQSNPGSTAQVQGIWGRLKRKKFCWTTHHSQWSPTATSGSDKTSSIHSRQHPEVVPPDDWALVQQPPQSQPPALRRPLRQPPHLLLSLPPLLYQSPSMEGSERTIHS